MSDKENKQQNTSDDLIDIKSLIGNADGGGFTLDDILSEYGVSPKPAPEQAEPEETAEEDVDLPWPEAPRRPRQTDNVVAFPGAELSADEEDEDLVEPEEEPEEDEPEPFDEDEDEDSILR